jgi:hypothetical protein
LKITCYYKNIKKYKRADATGANYTPEKASALGAFLQMPWIPLKIHVGEISKTFIRIKETRKRKK